MSVNNHLQNLRDWFPVPLRGVRPRLIRWVLLEGNRYAILGALLTLVFAAIMLIGTVWTFQMQQVLTETRAVETILNTLLSGIILLVSIVVSINSIVLSHDITSVGTQEDRIQTVMEFRRDVGELTETGESPSDPASFLKLMGDVVEKRAEALADVATGIDGELAKNIHQYVDSVKDTVGRLDDSFQDVSGAQFGVLWLGLEVDYGSHLDRSRTLKATYEENFTDSVEERFDELMHAFEIFAVGKEYFKTLYYSQEISELSRTLLIISLPAILVNASAILAINAQLFPEVWIFGLPPLLSFVATVFTISLAPYLVLTSYMLRLATVARRTTSAGPFSLE